MKKTLTKLGNSLKTFKKQKSKAFTLIELLIAISIFMIFLTVAGSSYLSIVRAQKSANEVRRMYSDLREFIDLLNAEMREGKIAYLCYGAIPENFTISASYCDGGSTSMEYKTTLIILGKENLKATHFIVSNDSNPKTLTIKTFQRNNLTESWGQAQAREVAFQSLKINNLEFDIYPKKDPNAAESFKDLSTQIQPMVFVNLSVESENPTVNFQLDYQTLISTRFNQ